MTEQELALEAFGESLGAFFFLLILAYYLLQTSRLLRRKKLGDTDGVKKVKKQMLWGIPIWIALIFLAAFLAAILL